MGRVVLCIGSNRSRSDVEKCLNWLATMLGDYQSSGIYETPAVNGSERNYHNSVVTGITNLSLDQFVGVAKDYEKAFGRDESTRKSGIVPIDVDIVIYDDQIIREWDYRQNFFKIGYSKLTCAVIKV